MFRFGQASKVSTFNFLVFADGALSADSDDESLSSSSEGSSSSTSSSSSSSEDEDEEEGERADSEGLDTMDESTMDSSTLEKDDDRCEILCVLQSRSCLVPVSKSSRTWSTDLNITLTNVLLVILLFLAHMLFSMIDSLIDSAVFPQGKAPQLRFPRQIPKQVGLV